MPLFGYFEMQYKLYANEIKKLRERMKFIGKAIAYL
jgi:hypothetical protein